MKYCLFTILFFALVALVNAQDEDGGCLVMDLITLYGVP